MENQVNNSNYSKEQLEKVNQRIENTPVVIRRDEDNFFGVIANYKITDNKKTPEEVEEEVRQPNWVCVMALMDILNERIERLEGNEIPTGEVEHVTSVELN